uniref:Uncharacterized protein n=1 Tax=Arundo donax TaxID=35708 RepID=A0A0A9AX25_ARUDO
MLLVLRMNSCACLT